MIHIKKIGSILLRSQRHSQSTASHYLYSSASNYVNDVGLVFIEKADNPIVDVMNLNNLQRYDSY